MKELESETEPHELDSDVLVVLEDVLLQIEEQEDRGGDPAEIAALRTTASELLEQL